VRASCASREQPGSEVRRTFSKSRETDEGLAELTTWCSPLSLWLCRIMSRYRENIGAGSTFDPVSPENVSKVDNLRLW